MSSSVKKKNSKSSSKKAIKRNTFTREEKLRAVMLYRETGNLSATAKEVGTSRTALNTWVREFKHIQSVSPDVAQACVQAVLDASHIRQEFLSRHYQNLTNTIAKAIQKIDDLLKDCNSLPIANQTLQTLASIVKEFTPTDNNNDKGIQVNLLQQTISQEKIE